MSNLSLFFSYSLASPQLRLLELYHVEVEFKEERLNVLYLLDEKVCWLSFPFAFDANHCLTTQFTYVMRLPD